MNTSVVGDLMLDLVAWLAPAPRPYAEAIEAWRTSCPRLTVWEDAMEAGWIACETQADGALSVIATAEGLECLRRFRPHHHAE